MRPYPNVTKQDLINLGKLTEQEKNQRVVQLKENFEANS